MLTCPALFLIFNSNHNDKSMHPFGQHSIYLINLTIIANLESLDTLTSWTILRNFHLLTEGAEVMLHERTSREASASKQNYPTKMCLSRILYNQSSWQYPPEMCLLCPNISWCMTYITYIVILAS